MFWAWLVSQFIKSSADYYVFKWVHTPSYPAWWGFLLRDHKVSKLCRVLQADWLLSGSIKITVCHVLLLLTWLTLYRVDFALSCKLPSEPYDASSSRNFLTLTGFWTLNISLFCQCINIWVWRNFLNFNGCCSSDQNIQASSHLSHSLTVFSVCYVTEFLITWRMIAMYTRYWFMMLR